MRNMRMLNAAIILLRLFQLVAFTCPLLLLQSSDAQTQQDSNCDGCTAPLKLVRIERLMSSDQLRKTGVSQLVPLERKALNEWAASNRSLLANAAFGNAASPGAPEQSEALYAIRVEVLMSASELQETGIARLRPKQRKALNEWLGSHVTQSGSLLADYHSADVQLQTEVLRRKMADQQARQKKAADIAAEERARLEAQQTYRVTVMSITSNPAGAEINVDGAFLGSTPAELPLAPGKRTIRLSKKGYRAYERSIEVLPEGKQRIAVDLEQE